MIIHKIKKYNLALAKANKAAKKIDTLMIGLNFKINIVLLGEVLSKDGNIFSNLYIKILVAQSSELMPKLFLHFDFVTEGDGRQSADDGLYNQGEELYHAVSISTAPSSASSSLRLVLPRCVDGLRCGRLEHPRSRLLP